MRLRELIFEASYFDQALLMVADMPDGFVYSGCFKPLTIDS